MIRYVLANLAFVLIILAAFFALLIYSVPSRAGECKGQLVIASFYGAESGSRTASGRFFDGTQLLAAHKSLPFHTLVRFTYQGKSVVVPIEDRGPYIRGRVFDLSRAAAERIGMVGAGVVRLCAERL